MSRPTSVHAAIAAHRFGLGEPSADGLRDDPQAWLLAQIGPADSPRGDGLLSTAQALDLVAAERAIRQQALAAQPSASAAAGAATAAAADSQLSRKRRAAPSFLDPRGGRAGRSPVLGVLMRKRTAARSSLIPLGGRTTYVVGLGALSGHYREAIAADVRCRLVTATETQRLLVC